MDNKEKHNTSKIDKIIYQVYPLSFRSSKNKKFGDIKGVIEKLGYIKSLGTDYIWLNPIFPSPLADHGYDSTDMKSINPIFGNMNDFDELVKEARKFNIGIMMDIVSIYTSDEHSWFQNSIKNVLPYKDFYVWRDKPINGFNSQFENEAWTFNHSRNQFYLHNFAKKQPNLNWSNPKMIDIYSDIINFWINKGVKGFRFDVMDMIGNNPDKGITIDIERAYKIIRKIGEKSWLKHDLFTVGECWSTSRDHARKFISKLNGVFTTIFNARYMDKNWYGSRWDTIPLKGEDFKEIKNWIFETRLLNEKKCYIPNFIENHDFQRSVSRYFSKDGFSNRKAKLILISFYGFLGPSFVFQGQEIGVENPIFKISDYQDPETKMFLRNAIGDSIEERANNGSRDNARTMVLWNKEQPKRTWLKCKFRNPKYVDLEVKDKNSVVNFYREFFKWKKRYFNGFEYIKCLPLMIDSPYIFAYKYIVNKNKEIIFVGNWDSQKRKIIFKYDKLLMGDNLKDNFLPPYGSAVLRRSI